MVTGSTKRTKIGVRLGASQGVTTLWVTIKKGVINMINRIIYKDFIEDCYYNDSGVGLQNGVPFPCVNMLCSNCDWNGDCSQFYKWTIEHSQFTLEEISEQYAKILNLFDTVMVSDDYNNWYKGKFIGVSNGTIYCVTNSPMNKAQAIIRPCRFIRLPLSNEIGE